MGNKLGVLVIGTGWVSGEHIKAYMKNPHTEIRGLCDIDIEKAEGVKRRLGLDCRVSGDYRDLVAWEAIDVVSVCTVHRFHYEQARAALEAGKHTMVEKPLCIRFDHLRELRELAVKTKLKTAVGFVARWYSAIKGLKKMVDAGAIGEPFYLESGYWHEVAAGWKSSAKEAGTSLLTGGCHSVDMIRYFQKPGVEATEVFAYSLGPKRRPDYTYDPTVALMVRFDNGSIGVVGTSLEANMPYVFHLQVLGTQGAVHGPRIYSESLLGEEAFMNVPGVYPDSHDVVHHPFDEELDYFIDCIVQDREPMISIQDAYKTYEITFAAEHSAKTGKPVSLPFAGE
ncbi:MAG TPA: Gfo/Idh/MocA family oxidoreductase [Spirochaetia bacterium]|nr:Gfo/Idh/MocA family oxidoreductase [Spirochaetia bacterium]